MGTGLLQDYRNQLPSFRKFHNFPNIPTLDYARELSLRTMVIQVYSFVFLNLWIQSYVASTLKSKRRFLKDTRTNFEDYCNFLVEFLKNL